MDMKEIYKWKPWGMVVLASERPGFKFCLSLPSCVGFYLFFCTHLNHSEPQFSHLLSGVNDTSPGEVFKDK